MQTAYASVTDEAEGSRPRADEERRRAGAWFAREAQSELTSVSTFVRMLGELTAHAAPPALLDRVRAAIREERQHADALIRLARRHGVHGVTARRRASTIAPAGRGLARLAAQNMADGCIGDTWVALCSRHQARHAHDQEVRTVMDAISRDESRHAELAFALHRWAWDRLATADRQVVDGIRRFCVSDLRRRVSTTSRAPAALGLPDRDHASRMVDVLGASIWASTDA